MKGTVQMPTEAEIKVEGDIKALMEQIEASKAASANETDDVKAAKAIQKAAKMLEDAIGYTAVWERDDVKPNLAQAKGYVTRLQTLGTLIAPVAVFDRSAGASIAGRLKMAVSAAEAGYLPAELGKAAAEAVAAWGTVKGGGSSGPRASKGAGSLGYQILISHPKFDKTLSDSTGKGSAMSSALQKLGKLCDPKVESAAKAKWSEAGMEQVHTDLGSAIEKVLAGEDEVTVGDWTVKAEGRKAEEAEAA